MAAGYVPGPVSPSAAPAPPQGDIDESAVRHALDSYRHAYEQLDVEAAADVWPSVDRRALSRAFDTIESQALSFERCAVSVAEAQATAQCLGTLRFVPSVGASMPTRTQQQWVFELQKVGDAWKIAGVSASRPPSP